MELEAGNKNPIDGINRIYEGICSRPRGSHDPNNFNLLDYYYICNEYGINFDLITTICTERNMNDELERIKGFHIKYIRTITLGSTDEYEILQVKIILNGREITMDEKEAVMFKLKEDGIPINSVSFNLAVKRYVAGTFKVYLEKSRK